MQNNNEKDNDQKNKKNSQTQINYQQVVTYFSKNSGVAVAIKFDLSIFSINQEDKIIILGLYSLNRQLKKMIVLDNQDVVSCLVFMKNSNEIISASFRGTIKIWLKYKTFTWVVEKTINTDQGQLHCLAVNKDEDLIISAGQYYTIKFWRKAIDWQCSEVISTHEFCIISISMNLSENRLISLDQLGVIFIQELIQNQWVMKQQCIIEDANRIGFINQNVFIVVQEWGKKLLIYELKQETNEFEYTKKIVIPETLTCQWYFPIKSIQSKRLIFIKKGEFVNMLSQGENGELNVLQSIYFNSLRMVGTVDDYGEYLIINEDKIYSRYNKISIRKLKGY